MTPAYLERGIARAELSGPVAVCGDIHGRLDLLDKLLAALPARTQLVHCGDLVDRGPSSRGVLDRLLEVGALGVRGNHEEWFCQWQFGPGLDRFGLMLGATTLASYGLDPRLSLAALDAARGVVPAAHRHLLDALPLALDLVVEGVPYWVIHAGVCDEPGLLASMNRAEEFVWPEDVAATVPWLVAHHRDELLWTKTPAELQRDVGRTVLFGHVPDRVPHDLGHCIALDTGAGKAIPDAALTAVLLPERRFISVR
jgi:serine/threonine protein phosphatase 1